MDARGDRPVAAAAPGRAWRSRQNRHGIHRRRAERRGAKGNDEAAGGRRGAGRRRVRGSAALQDAGRCRGQHHASGGIDAQVALAGRTRGRGARLERGAARQTPCGDDFPQPQSGTSQAPRKGRDRRLVPHLAGNTGCLLRLAGCSQTGAGFSRQVSAAGVRGMSTPGTVAPGSGALELPPFSLDVQALDLGGDVKAVGLELIETQNREPVRGKDAAAIWSVVFPALAGKESYAGDVFSHVVRGLEISKTLRNALPEAPARADE